MKIHFSSVLIFSLLGTLAFLFFPLHVKHASVIPVNADVSKSRTVCFNAHPVSFLGQKSRVNIFLKGTTVSNGWITRLLSQLSKYDFKRVSTMYEADIIILELFDPDFLRILEDFQKNKHAVSVLWSGENTNWNELGGHVVNVSVVAGYSRDEDILSGISYARLPSSFILFVDPETRWFKASFHEWENFDAEAKWLARPLNVSFVASHLAFPREQIVSLATNAFGRVDCLGKALLNMEWRPVNKLELLKDYKFNICPENSIREGYTTEKLYDALIAGAVPVYWPGSPLPEPEILNAKKIIFHSGNDTGEKMLHLLSDPYRRLKYFREPVFQEGAQKYVGKVLNTFAAKVISQLDNLLAARQAKSWRYCNINLTSSKSQEAQDVIVNQDFFAQVCEGVFLEVGGADGITNSNTYAFEVDKSWSGILIEASPSAFLLMSQRAERKHSVKVHGGVADSEGNATFIDISGPQAQLSCIKEFASPGHLERIRQEMTANGLGKRTDVQVLIKPVTQWLVAHNIFHVNFFSLDVEGAELLVLKTIDFERITIDVITVEINEHVNEIIALLKEKGFRVHKQLTLGVIFCNSATVCKGKK
jgi:FkbM family methyltransferase